MDVVAGVALAAAVGFFCSCCPCFFCLLPPFSMPLRALFSLLSALGGTPGMTSRRCQRSWSFGIGVRYCGLK